MNRAPTTPAPFAALDYIMLAFCVATVMALVLMWATAARADQRGMASWYWQPQRLACGGRLTGSSDGRMWAAHKTLPCGTRVRVTARSGASVVVTIMDRGPFVRGRIIDLFPAPARALGMTGAGVVPVNVEVVR